MCGICGIIRKNEENVTKETISRMCDTILHRGPDSEGVLVGASGIQQQASQSFTDLTITSTGSVPVVDGSITYTVNEGLDGL